MRHFMLAMAVAFGLAASPAKAAKGSAGIVLSYPEIFGVYGSLWPMESLSFDLRVTLSTLDLGVTGHILLAENGPEVRHDLLFTGMGGWVHDAVANSTWGHYRGAHFIAAAGYGLQAGWDLRILAGLSVYHGTAAWAAGPTAMLLAGHSF